MSQIRRRCRKCRKKFLATADFFTRNARLPGGITHTCKKCQARYMRQWSRKNRKKTRAAGKRWRDANREQARTITARGKRALRNEFLAAYGARCACCGETEATFLTLEHIGGGGSQDRRSSGGTHMIFLRLKRQGWPKDRFTVLCHNCQFGERIGGCPHKHQGPK